MKKENISAYLALLLTFILWGSIYVVSSYATNVYSPVVVACVRYVVAMLPLSIMARGKLNIKIAREDIKDLLIVAVLGYYFTITINTVGIKLSGASMSSLINSMVPVGVTLVAAKVLKEKIDLVRILCIALAIAGTLIVVSGAKNDGQLWGVICMIIGLFTWSTASVFIKKLSAKYPPVVVTVYAIAISLLIHIPVTVVDVIRNGIVWDTGAALAVIYMGIFATGVTQYLWSKSLSVLEAGVCSMFYPLQPVFSVILGRIFLSEQLQPKFFIGAAIIAVNVIINCLWSEHKNRLAEKEKQ